MTKIESLTFVGSAAIGGLSTLAFTLAPSSNALAATITTLYNTGVDSSTGALLSEGTADSNYTITSPPPGFNSGSTPLARTSSSPSAVWPLTGPWLGDNTTSRWIGPNSTGDFDGPSGDYTYRTSFSLAGFDPSTASITGQWATDNTGLDILLNGVSISSLGGSSSSPIYNAFQSFSVASGFVAGTNTLDFVFNNVPNPNDARPNPTGLRVEMVGTADFASTAVPEPSEMVGTVVAFGSIVLLKRKLSKKK